MMCSSLREKLKELDIHDRETFDAVVGYSDTPYGWSAYLKLLRARGVFPQDVEAVRDLLEEWLVCSSAPRMQKRRVRELLEDPSVLNFV
jgi:MoxR-like ATPase